MATAPTTIRAIRQAGEFELQWSGGPLHHVPFHLLRCACPCASCIDEFTGRKILDPAAVPPDVAPTQMSFVGNYALKIVWSDGHSTGLYTFDQLAEIAEGRELEG